MMERALKERIIGAVILVVIAVSIVPVFLDGPPKEGEVKSERVLLPGQTDQETRTVVLDRERNEPIPIATVDDPEPMAPAEESADEPVAELVAEAASSSSAEEQQSAVVDTPLPQAPPSQSAREPALSSPSATGMWAVQLGSFSSKENAENLAASLRKQGYAAFLSQLQANSGPLHRVRIGPQKDRESADAMSERLLKVGHKGQVVPHP